MSAFHENWLQSVCVCIGTRLRDCIIITPRISLDILYSKHVGQAMLDSIWCSIPCQRANTLFCFKKTQYIIEFSRFWLYQTWFVSVEPQCLYPENISYIHIYPIYHHLDTTMSTKQITSNNHKKEKKHYFCLFFCLFFCSQDNVACFFASARGVVMQSMQSRTSHETGPGHSGTFW